jgi:cellulose synthase/poly-beta-1,6-N-acetylglucosamine synthase-like glycosyltransferase
VKPIQDYFGKPMISSGCFSVYRTEAVLEISGWPTRTLAEDMDLTWSFYERGWKVRFVPSAACYPLEPASFRFLHKQLRRWSHGFVQNVRLHFREILGMPYLRSVLIVALVDATLASLLYLILVPVVAVLVDPRFLAAYVIDAPAVALPVLAGAVPRREVRKALASLPCFFVLRLVNAAYFLHALWLELVRGRTLDNYEKGH